jgi:hypothetical protein
VETLIKGLIDDLKIKRYSIRLVPYADKPLADKVRDNLENSEDALLALDALFNDELVLHANPNQTR